MRLYRKGIPKETKILENKEERSVLHVFYSDGKNLLELYISKKKTDKGNHIYINYMTIQNVA